MRLRDYCQKTNDTKYKGAIFENRFNYRDTWSISRGSHIKLYFPLRKSLNHSHLSSDNICKTYFSTTKKWRNFATDRLCWYWIHHPYTDRFCITVNRQVAPFSLHASRGLSRNHHLPIWKKTKTKKAHRNQKYITISRDISVRNLRERGILEIY